MTPNLFTDLPAGLPEELFTTLMQAPDVRIERIVSRGHQSPDGFWYDQPTGDRVIVLEGAAMIKVEDSEVEIIYRDCHEVRAHTKHRVAWTTPEEPTIWLAVQYRVGY